MILHLATNNEYGFNYLAYLATISAIKYNTVKLWYEDEPETKWFELIKKIEARSDFFEFAELDPFAGLTLDATDQTGRLDIIYLAPFTMEKSIDDAFIDHNLFQQKGDGEFERKDITLVRVFTPPSQQNLDFITPEWVIANDTLLSALIKRLFLERVWNPYGRE